MGPDWDALNQAARANEASRKSAEAVCAFAEALADRLEVRARDPFAGPESTVYAAMATEVRAVLKEIADAAGMADPVKEWVRAPVSRTVTYLGPECMDRRCQREHDTLGRHTA